MAHAYYRRGFASVWMPARFHQRKLVLQQDEATELVPVIEVRGKRREDRRQSHLLEDGERGKFGTCVTSVGTKDAVGVPA